MKTIKIILLLLGAYIGWAFLQRADGIYVMTESDGCIDEIELLPNGEYVRVVRDEHLELVDSLKGQWSYSNQHVFLNDWIDVCDVIWFEPSREPVNIGCSVSRDFLWRINRINVDPDADVYYRRK